MPFEIKIISKANLALCCAALCTGCGRIPVTTLLTSDYERTLDAYEQTDTTMTDVTSSRAADGRDVELVSAFFGMDDALPRFSGRFICEGSGSKDGMPVIFSHELDPKTVEPGDFKVTTSSGMVGEVTCLTLAPADDQGELRTVLLVGQFGGVDDQPDTVEVVGNILSIDGSANFKGSIIGVTALESGPTMVWAEVVREDEWTLEAEGTSLPFGGGSGCPAGTRQIVRVTWDGGITRPGGQPADDLERQLYQVTVVREDGTETQITPFALADLRDGDNNHKLCLDTNERVKSVFFPAGHLTDPREDLNPSTSISTVNPPPI